MKCLLESINGLMKPINMSWTRGINKARWLIHINFLLQHSLRNISLVEEANFNNGKQQESLNSCLFSYWWKGITISNPVLWWKPLAMNRALYLLLTEPSGLYLIQNTHLHPKRFLVVFFETRDDVPWVFKVSHPNLRGVAGTRCSKTRAYQSWYL